MAGNKKSKKAFTIIELLVVITVIGILAAITIVAYSGITNRAIIASIQSDLTNSKRLLELDKTISGNYPLTSEAANGGKGLKNSNDTTMSYEYSPILNGYCVEISSNSNSSIVYHISNIDETIIGGCPFVLGSWKYIALGNSHSCAIDLNDQGYCWGWNRDGQLGNGSMDDSQAPVAVSQGAMPSLSIKNIAVGSSHSCAVASDDHVYCWGENSYYGQLGNNSTIDSAIPVAVSQGAMPSLDVKDIAVGQSHSCVVASDDRIYCWGDNYTGRLGNNSTVNASIPVAVSQGVRPSLNVKQMSIGAYNTCVIAIDDRAYCWGDNEYGQLGNNSAGGTGLIPVAVSQGAMPSLNVKSISLGDSHACAVAMNNQAYCWGRGEHGQLGNDPKINTSTPTALPRGKMPSLEVTQIELNDYETLTISSNHQIYYWGGFNIHEG